MCDQQVEVAGAHQPVAVGWFQVQQGQLDCGVTPAQFGEGGGHQGGAGGGEGADRDPALLGPRGQGGGRLGLAQLTEHALTVLDEDRADVGEPYPGPTSLDQPCLELRLELAQLLGHCRGRVRHPTGRLGDGSGAGDFDEHSQPADVQGH